MAQLIVRNLDPALVRRLKQRAAANNRAAEAEHREILKQALAAPTRGSLKAALLAIPDVGQDADFARPRVRTRRTRL
jgi:plasmid stability protein